MSSDVCMSCRNKVYSPMKPRRGRSMKERDQKVGHTLASPRPVYGANKHDVMRRT
jgi:hypothetical protein